MNRIKLAYKASKYVGHYQHVSTTHTHSKKTLSWWAFPSCTTAPDGGGSTVRGRPYGSFVCCMMESGTGGHRIGRSGGH
eukprot:364966-Chlamydomonas_euryale.AAC.2